MAVRLRAMLPFDLSRSIREPVAVIVLADEFQPRLRLLLPSLAEYLPLQRAVP